MLTHQSPDLRACGGGSHCALWVWFGFVLLCFVLICFSGLNMPWMALSESLAAKNTDLPCSTGWWNTSGLCKEKTSEA